MRAYPGQNPETREPLDLAQAVREALPLSQLSIPPSIRLKTECPSPGPRIKATGVHIQQILANVIANSAEAIGDQEGEIAVTVGVVDEADISASRYFPLDWTLKTTTYACISVSDTGCGLDAAQLEKIFEPFFSTKFTGRGLGLSVVLGDPVERRRHQRRDAPGPWHDLPRYFPNYRGRGHNQQIGVRPPELSDQTGWCSADDEPLVRDMAAAQLNG